MHGELHIASALNVQTPDDLQSGISQHLILGIIEGLSRSYDYAVPGVYAGGIKIFHRADDDAVVSGISDYLVFYFLPAGYGFFHQYLTDGTLLYAHEGGNLENPWNEHKKDIHVLSVEPEDAPDEVTYVTISFDKGIPVAIDDQEMGPVEILTKLNELGSKNGVGTIDIIENRLVGMKSRGVYETPGGTILFQAHRDLEKLVLDRDTMAYKNIVAQKFSELCYDGLWFTPLREAISAFVDVTQEQITGKVKMKLYKGTA